MITTLIYYVACFGTGFTCSRIICDSDETKYAKAIAVFTFAALFYFNVTDSITLHR
jgi:hypothetical protein